MNESAATMRWVRACVVADLIPDEGYRLDVSPPVSIFLSGGEMFCVDDTCTHETYSLADGWVENCVVECALHFAKFDLRTGAVLSPPAPAPLAAHELRVEGEDVHVLLPSHYVVKTHLHSRRAD